MQAELSCHPLHPSGAVDRISVTVERLSEARMRLDYLVVGRIDQIVLPPPAEPLRTDRLWMTTCFEAFLAPVSKAGYREFNFSPSSRWAAYHLAGYRQRMTKAPLPAPPVIEMSRQSDRLELVVTLSLDLPHGLYDMALAAIIDEQSGDKSFWALSHPPDAPDFHHPTCFDVELPPAPRP